VGSDELERDDTGGESVETDKGTGGEERERERERERGGERSAEEKRKRKGNIWNEGGKEPLVDAFVTLKFSIYSTRISVRTIVHGMDRQRGA